MITNIQENSSSKMCDANYLYSASVKALKIANWKYVSQNFAIHRLEYIGITQNQLAEGNYKVDEKNRFLLSDRGKIRACAASSPKDKMVGHVLCDEYINTSIAPYVIKQNGASQIGKGIEKQREWLRADLWNYYKNYGTDGWVLIGDFSRFYDNIQHKTFYNQIIEHIDDPVAIEVLQKSLDSMKVDVSYLSDKEYSHCMDIKFDSIANWNIDSNLKTKEKFMDKCVDTGDQVAQCAGVYYPYPIDNLIKIVLGHRYYGRYCDDFYIICDSKEKLENTLKAIKKACKKLGIFLNLKKTHISPLRCGFKFLRRFYHLEESGRISEKVWKNNIAKEKRRLRKLADMVENGNRDFFNTINGA